MAGSVGVPFAEGEGDLAGQRAEVERGDVQSGVEDKQEGRGGGEGEGRGGGGPGQEGPEEALT